jgi:F0F1-type ATP synthase delta subunit
MARVTKTAAPYAKALFALAKERNQAELVDRELDEAAVAFEGTCS